MRVATVREWDGWIRDGGDEEQCLSGAPCEGRACVGCRQRFRQHCRDAPACSLDRSATAPCPVVRPRKRCSLGAYACGSNRAGTLAGGVSSRRGDQPRSSLLFIGRGPCRRSTGIAAPRRALRTQGHPTRNRSITPTRHLSSTATHYLSSTATPHLATTPTQHLGTAHTHDQHGAQTCIKWSRSWAVLRVIVRSGRCTGKLRGRQIPTRATWGRECPR